MFRPIIWSIMWPFEQHENQYHNCKYYLRVRFQMFEIVILNVTLFEWSEDDHFIGQNM